MNTLGKALYPFVPSGADFQTALRFFEDLGFVEQWGDNDLAGLRFGEPISCCKISMPCLAGEPDDYL
jgi:hypothetical protein